MADGPFWQMDCMTSYFPWIPPRVLAVGGTPDGAVAVSEVNATTRSITHLYAYNSSLAAVPVSGANPTDPNDGMLYFAARNPSTGKSKVGQRDAMRFNTSMCVVFEHTQCAPRQCPTLFVKDQPCNMTLCRPCVFVLADL